MGRRGDGGGVGEIFVWLMVEDIYVGLVFCGYGERNLIAFSGFGPRWQACGYVYLYMWWVGDFGEKMRWVYDLFVPILFIIFVGVYRYL